MQREKNARGVQVEMPNWLYRQLRDKAFKRDTKIKHLVINTLCRALRLEKPKGAK